MFIVFVVFLLYLCALITTNFSYFGKTGAFYGLSPIPGLTEYLGATLVLFIIFLVLIFTSVSSYVFDRKKGIGFEFGEKENKGYSRWCKEKEMKSDKGVEVVDPLATESPVAGIPLVNDGKHLWVDNGEYHNLVIGSTGSGKSQTVVEPMVELLIKKGESMIITDPKGELYKAASVYMKERGYNVVVLNFREPQNGNAWNPLTLPYQYYQDGNYDKATELLDDVGMNILYDPNNKSGDPFWEKSSADYFSGLSLGLFEDALEAEINLNSINYMSTVGEEKFAASNYIKEYFTLKGEASNAYVFASNTINSPAETKGGILAVFRQKIRLFASRENLSEMLSYSDFDMRNIGKEKTAVFIVIHDEKTTYHGLATIFIKQCYETLIDVAQSNGGKLPFRTNFILDEFANMPPLKDVTTMVTAARSRSIRFTFIIQNFAQLKSVYGNEDAETIKGNCGNLVYLISTELAALEEISKMCGEVKSGDKEKTSSTPLVTVTDLQKLKLFEAIIIRWRLSPFKTKYTPNFKMDWGHSKFEAEFPLRKKREVKLFDVKEFTKKKKSEKIKNSLNEKGTGVGNPFGFDKPNPFGGGNRPNPFGANPFDVPEEPKKDGGLFGGLGGGIDLDAMMKDIDRKIAELDAEEARQKEKQTQMKGTDLNTPALPNIPDLPTKNSLDTAMFHTPVSHPTIPDLPKKEEGGMHLFDTNPLPMDLPPFDLPKTELPKVDLPKMDTPKNDFMDLGLPQNDIGLSKTSDTIFDNSLGNNSNLDNLKSTVKDVNPFEEKNIVKEQLSIDNHMEDLSGLLGDNGSSTIKNYSGNINTTNSVSFSIPNNLSNSSNGMTQANEFNIFGNSSTQKNSPFSSNLDKPKMAIATSSPLEEDDFKFDTLPKVEQASVIQPNYNSGSVVKTNTINEYNIYNTIPNIMDNVKDDIKTEQEIKKETDHFVQSIEVSKDKMKDISTKLNDYNGYVQSSDVLPVQEKANVNIDPDKIVINSNNPISDDEFFDDFFGD